MTHQPNLIADDIHAYLKAQEEKSLLRFITCGSVDDGKSTLIGRLLWDSKQLFEDQLAALKSDSKRVGTQGDEIDYALLLDGLQAEREQGITIDVAYRFFSTDRRKFIVADTPGHEQYTRNMVTGASTAQVAVILIDARKGVLPQTRRHSYLVSLVGIRRVVLAINKMDLVDYSASRFEAIRKEYELFAAQLGFEQIAAIPLSALKGDNVLDPSCKMPWYVGPTLMEQLETVEIVDTAATRPFRMRVQWVNRPHLDFRGYCGTIASGSIRPGDAIVVTSSGQTSRVDRIVTMDGDLDQAFAGQAVTLTLVDEIDISRGDLLATTETLPDHAERFVAKLAWLHEEALLPGRSYLLKAGATTAPAQIECLQHKINVNTLKQEPGTRLELNEVGVCSLNISRPISFDAYLDNRSSGSFILIDRMTNATVGAGMIVGPLAASGSGNVSPAGINSRATALLKGQEANIFWFSEPGTETHLSLSGMVAQKLLSLGKPAFLLEDERLSQGLNLDLGITADDCLEALRRLREVARICSDAGLIVVVSSRSVLAAGADLEGITLVDIDPTGDQGGSVAVQSVEEKAEQLVRSYFS